MEERRELPVGWVEAPIGNLCESIEQRVPDSDEKFFYIDIGSVDRVKKVITLPTEMLGHDAPSRARKCVREGDVLVSMTRPNLNAVALVPPELDGHIATTGFDVLRSSEVDCRWLFYLVRSGGFVDAMSDLVQGALYPAIKAKDIRAYQIPVAPLNEQRRIAAKLDTTLAAVDTCRQRLDGVEAILKRFRQAVLAAATSGELTWEWREERGITAEWKTQALSGICVSISDGDHQAPPKSAEGIPFITISAINGAVLRLDRATRFVPRSYYDGLSDVRKARENDILFSVTGSVGIPALVDSPQRFVFQRHIALLRPDRAVVLARFLYFSLLDESVKRQCLKVATGTAQLTISLGSLRSLTLSIPSLQEQAKVVSVVEDFFSLADQLEARLHAARKVVDRLTPALLAKAFRGELVPQDPRDEPASVLLERIRAARQAEAGAGKPSRRGRPRAAATLEQTPRNAAPVPSDSLPPDVLACLLRECGPLSERALLAASDLAPERFQRQLATEIDAGGIREELEEGEKVLVLGG